MIRIFISLVVLFSVFPSLGAEGDEVVFDSTIESVVSLYRARFPKPLVINKDWYDPSLNGIIKEHSDRYQLDIAGGLMRVKNLTLDGFTFLICHEVGHILGGAPIYGEKALVPEDEFLAVEGQADYWAANKCFKKFLQGKDNIGFVAAFSEKFKESFKFKDTIKKSGPLCREKWSTAEEVAICQRTLFAGHSFARTIRVWTMEKEWININTPATKIATETFPYHPLAQCRFDTVLAGSMCTLSLQNINQAGDVWAGNCNRKDGFMDSARPRCWFKPPSED
ncbi:MAG: hypothetical protein AAF203_02460 [Pseudomonadota bacterium]